MANHSLIRTLTLALALILSACVTQQTKVKGMQEKQLLAEQLLSQAVYINTIFSECEILSDDVELEVISTQQDWLQKNWPLITAADQYLADEERSNGLLYEGTLISLKTTYLAHEARQKALDELNFSQRTTANQQRYCISRLKKIAAEEMDLATGLGRKTLPFKLEPIAGASIQIDSIPQLAFKTSRIQTPGRTWFPLEEGFKQECAQPQQILLLNDWPKEAYAIYCEGRPLALMVCEWGKCERKQE